MDTAQLCSIVVAWVGEALAGFLAGCTDTFLDVVRHSESMLLGQVVVGGIPVLIDSRQTCCVVGMLSRARSRAGRRGTSGIEIDIECFAAEVGCMVAWGLCCYSLPYLDAPVALSLVTSACLSWAFAYSQDCLYWVAQVV